MSNSSPSILGGIAAAVVLCAGFAFGQVVSADSTSVQHAPTQASGPVLTGFHLKKGTVQHLALPQQRVPGFRVDVELGGRTYTLQLHEYDVRTKDFKLIVHDQNGYRTVPTPANTTYRGAVTGFPASLVSASLIQGQLHAVVDFGKQPSPTWGIQPVSDVLKASPRTAHVVYDSADSNLPPHRCGVSDLAPSVPAPQVSSMGANSVCEIACDADLPFYQLNGSNVTNTQNDVTNVINRVDAIYKRDVQIEYKITQIIVRTAQVYTSNDAGTLLNQFRSYWLNYHGSVKRDVAHLFTGRNINSSTIGVAWLGAICTTSGFGLSQSRFTSNLTSRTGLTAHELGHNWGASHCSGGGCYIMCAGLGGCGQNVTLFNTGSKNAIIAHRNSRSCLSSSVPAPALTAISPTMAQAWRNDTMVLTGTNLTGVTSVYVGTKLLSTTGTPGFRVINDSRIEFDTFVPPTMQPVAVSAEGPGGKSNGLVLFYQPTSPPRLDVQSTILPTQFLVWEFSGGVNNSFFLTAGATGTTFKLFGFDWLLNPAILTTGTVNAVGFGLIYVQVPANVGKGLKVFSQVVMADFQQGVISGTTNVASTTVQ